MKKDVTELQRNEQVAAYCNKATELFNSGDIAGAMKQLEFASRMDAGNPHIQKIMDKVKPKYDEMEKKRKAGLSAVERYKESGDQAYKNANFEDAVQHYTKCLDQLEKEGKQGSDLALKAYANRAGESDLRIYFVFELKMWLVSTKNASRHYGCLVTACLWPVCQNTIDQPSRHCRFLFLFDCSLSFFSV